MRFKQLLGLLLASFLLVGATACGSDSEDKVAADDKASAADEGSGGDSDGKGSGDEGSGSDAGSGDGGSGSDGPGLLNLGDCMKAAAAYSSVYSSVFLGEAEAEKALAQLDEFRGDVPEDVQADIDLIREEIESAKNLRELGEIMDSAEVQEANDRVNAYFEEECGF